MKIHTPLFFGMKTYAAFAPPNDPRLEIIKNGFSFPGFFFGPLWLFMKRLWLLGALFLLGDGGLIAVSAAGWFNPDAALIIILAGRFFIGLDGSSWLQRKLLKRGYRLQDIIGAYSGTEALVSALNRAPQPLASGAMEKIHIPVPFAAPLPALEASLEASLETSLGERSPQ